MNFANIMEQIKTGIQKNILEYKERGKDENRKEYARLLYHARKKHKKPLFCRNQERRAGMGNRPRTQPRL